MPNKNRAQNVLTHNTRLLSKMVKTVLDLLDVISSDEVSTITEERWMTHMGKLGGKSIVWQKYVNRSYSYILTWVWHNLITDTYVHIHFEYNKKKGNMSIYDYQDTIIYDELKIELSIRYFWVTITYICNLICISNIMLCTL